MQDLTGFTKLGLPGALLKKIEAKGFEEPTPIQARVIPLLLENRTDIIAQAQTGTGKTAAFGLPLLATLDPGDRQVQALVLTPTRELAIQVAEEINSLKPHPELGVLPVYGGQSIELQLKKLKKGVGLVVGTPGRVLDHLNRRSLRLEGVKYLVLDEADEMLNMGFIEDMEAIMAYTSPEKRVLLFSATIPDRIRQLAEQYMVTPRIVQVKKKQLTTELADQIYFEVAETDKLEALCRIMDIEPEFYGLVFCCTRVKVDEVAGRLLDRGYEAEGLHGDMSQPQREKILDRFKKRRLSVLVATDVAARGLDIAGLSHVINYSLPQSPDAYVHRIGRTGRAGESGTAITFVTPAESRRLHFIRRAAGAEIRREKVPAVQDIIDRKKTQISDDLHEIIEAGDFSEYLEMAGELLAENSGPEVVAALLKYAFQQDLDASHYNEIRDVSVDRKGKTRLFIARGRRDGMTKKKLVDFVIKKSRVPGRKINNAQVFEQFSFITVPFVEAEVILRAFRKGGKRSIVEVAKPQGQ